MASPFTIRIPEERLSAIMRKVNAYDWDQLPDAGGWTAGVGVADLRRLVDYWQKDFDWRRVEERLNRLPNYIAEIDGVPIHYLHVKGDGSKPPVLLLHGWPGSYLEFERLLEPLAADGHDVIVPSLPGFAFSTPITHVVGPRRVGDMMHALMKELFGETRFFVQGGDWGAHIASWMAYTYPEALVGFHLNMVTLFAADARPEAPEDKALLDRRASSLKWETGYNHLQETRPQTLGVALADSPVGVAGWILEKIGKWSDLPITSDGAPDIWHKFSEEEVLTNIMLYLGPSAAVTATWIYHGKRLEKSGRLPAGARVRTPLGVAAFPDPVFLPPPRSLAESTYNIVHWSTPTSGGHFAAWEQPELLLADLRSFMAPLL